MSWAVPGFGECRICLELVSCVKILDCGHTICLPCTHRLIQAAVKPVISCAECRHETDCSKGITYLKTRYFGKISCDVCLESKDAEDMWWCGNCVQAFCSKCSITEHAHKQHTISEWNKMEPVQFSVNYLNGISYHRQLSAGSEHNERAIQMYLKAVEESLKKNLSIQPEVEELKENIFSHYGTRFSVESSGSSGSVTTPPPSAMEEGPKVLAKVLQLAGMERSVPKIRDESFQIYFTLTPDELASFIRSKVQFIPVQRPENPAHLGLNSAPLSSSENIVERAVPRHGDPVPVLQVDFCRVTETLALRTALEIQLYNLKTNKNYSIPVPSNNIFRNLCFSTESGDKELLIVYQSAAKKYHWSVEAFQIETLPITSVYSADFDIDPEDKVEALHLAATGEGNSSLYEIRQCTGHVSEIWRSTVTTKKKGKVKLKESLLYQKPSSRYTSLKVHVPHGKKERFLFVWDEMSCCLYRLIVKEHKCELATKVLHASEQIPFFLDKECRLWLFDPHLSQICVSRGSVINRVNVLFDEISKFSKHGLLGLWPTYDSLLGVSLTSTSILLVFYYKLPVAF